jgi:serine/threonine protein kinase
LEAILMREIESMRRLRHRNIVRLEEAFWVDTKLWMCMELVEGKSLLRWIPDEGLPADVARPLFFQLCSAVAYCHSHNVILFFEMIHTLPLSSSSFFHRLIYSALISFSSRRVMT